MYVEEDCDCKLALFLYLLEREDIAFQSRDYSYRPSECLWRSYLDATWSSPAGNSNILLTVTTVV